MAEGTNKTKVGGIFTRMRDQMIAKMRANQTSDTPTTLKEATGRNDDLITFAESWESIPLTEPGKIVPNFHHIS